jgi:ABC-type transport system involved in multi-copper enzyme maturation permease subunit
VSRLRAPSIGGIAAIRSSLVGTWTGIAAVSTKELRGRMRGRRAFVVLTFYLLLLSLFAWGIYQFQRQITAQVFDPFSGGGVPISAVVGQAIFSGLLVLETLLVVVLAPAMTAGAISMEREKQTLELLVTTPLGTVALVLGKLFSALTYVFLLILASIPLASVVFTFGGVGPEDLIRGYVFLFALAFGTGAIALFYSALLRRTQAATVLSYLTVLAVTLGATVVYIFWFAMIQRPEPSGAFFDERQQTRLPPESVLWLNPFVADADLICGTSINGYDLTCLAVAQIRGESIFNAADTGGVPTQDTVAAAKRAGVACPPNADCSVPDRPVPDPGAPAANLGNDAFSIPRDRFWPQSALAYAAIGALLTLLASQLVSPTRRFRLRRGRAGVAVAPRVVPAPTDQASA